MSVLEIREARREGARLVIGLAGRSGSGKTLTAIYLAYGMANYDPRKIGFIDTENRRGSLYADCLQKHPTHPTNVPFWIADLYAPFSPERYKQAIEEFQRAGVEVLIIDSASHEYEGEGGYLEIREPLPGKRGKRDNIAATEHKKFIRSMLQSSCDIVVCIRAREKVKIEEGINEQGHKASVYVPQGLQPIQHRDFMFELTASVMMHEEGRRQDVIKCPSELLNILGRGTGYITSEEGKSLRDWRDGGVKLDPAVEKARGDMLMVAEQGVEAVKSAWQGLTKEIRKALGAQFIEQCKASAEGFDQMRAAQAEDWQAWESNAGLDALNTAAAGVDTTADTPAVPEPAQMAKAEQVPTDGGNKHVSEAAQPAAQKAAAPRRSRAAAKPAQFTPEVSASVNAAHQVFGAASQPAAQSVVVQISEELYPDNVPAGDGPVPNVPPAEADDLPDF